ncbi:MAG: hypothetical protein K9M45_04250 [Kiritimatiellales bacterium]|nr:hypothetical protein [Kiritimatiellales bacterium]
MNKTSALLPLGAAIITFLLGFMATNKSDLSSAIPMFALSIILFVSAGILKISAQLADLKNEILKSNPKPNEPTKD